jgi:hypothetical protein
MIKLGIKGWIAKLWLKLWLKIPKRILLTRFKLLNICRMDRLRFGHERPTDSDCCLICTCLSVRNFENAINKSYTHVQPHCIFFFFQCDRDLYLIPGDSRTRGQHRFFQERSNYDTLRNSFQRTARE